MVSSGSDKSRDDDPDVDELAIRFVNTAAWRLRDRSEERLADADALLEWLRRNGIGTAREVNRLASLWRGDAADRDAAYRAAIALREAIYDILVAPTHHATPSPAALKTFNDFLARSAPAVALTWDAGGAAWGPKAQDDGLDFLKPIVVSAAALMTGPRARRVKQCQDDRGCGWLFVDESRAQNRRWCSMGDCGNRAKAHRHYQRARKQADG